MIPYACDLPDGTIVISGTLKIKFIKAEANHWKAKAGDYDDEHIDNVLAHNGTIERWGYDS